MKKAILLFVIVLVSIHQTFSQNAIDSLQLPASKQLFELLPVKFLWINTSNPVAVGDLTFNRFSLTEAGYRYDKKDFHYSHQPGETGSFFIVTKGYKKLNKISFFGDFEYHNSFYDQLVYNNTLEFDNWNPVMVGDTIGGRQVKEEFNLSGILSYSLSDKISVGAGIDYKSAVGAKLKDPRSKNNISYFRFSPGIAYKSGKIKAGISGSIFSRTNDVNVDIIASKSNFDLYKFNGLGYFEKETDFSNFETRYTSRGYSAEAQISFSSPSVSNLTTVSVSNENSVRRYGTSFRMIDGAYSTESYAVTDKLRINKGTLIHNLELSGNISYIYGNYGNEYKTLEIDIQGVPFFVQQIVREGDISLIINHHTGTLSYGIISQKSNGLKNIEAEISVQVDYYKSTRYPYVTEGSFNCLNLMLSLDARKTIFTGSFYITPGLGLYYRDNLSSDIVFYIPVNAKVLPQMAFNDFSSMKASVRGLNFFAEIEIPGKRSFIKTYFFKPEAAYCYTPDFGETTGSNLFAMATIGFTF